jgi:hypothetical protein
MTYKGAFCRWKIDFGKAWEHLGGELSGQTHVAYPPSPLSHSNSHQLPLCQPLDCHFAMGGTQGWGAARLALQAYRVDWCGRRLLLGYGFCHLPMAEGNYHNIQVTLT